MLKTFKSDIEIIRERDPAARGIIEIFLCYPGFQSIVIHRFTHKLWQLNIPLIPRLLSRGFTLPETREILHNDIEWRIKCGSRIIVSTPREDIGASMLIAEELSPTINVPVEVVPMEELEKVLSNSNDGTIVTSRYFLQPLEKVAKQHGVRAIAVDLSDFQKELKTVSYTHLRAHET